MERGQKRKPEMFGDEGGKFPLDELNQDLLERVLSWLPTSNFVRNTSVCKRWKSVADSATFKLACSQIPARDPWFFMVDFQPHLNYHPIVFDSTEKAWKKLNFLPLLQENQYQAPCCNFIPVAASGGLICFHRAPGEFIACNPVTGSFRQLASLVSHGQKSKHLQAIAMTSTTASFKLVSVSGEYPYSTLSFRIYNSSTDQWEENAILNRKIENPVETGTDDDFSLYFLSKCGNVISTNLQRNPCKQYSSVIILKDNEEILYFLSSSGTVVSCNLTHKFFFEYPRILPVFSEYAIDIIECGGEIYVVVLHEFLETASLRVWKWDEKNHLWVQIAAMPPAMSHEFYGEKVDINCSGTGAGAGHQMLVCLNSAQKYSYVLCNLVTNEWIELPQCYMNGEAKELVCAFSFEPRIEASL